MVTRAPVRRYSLPDTLQTINPVCLLFCAISTQNIPQPSQETREISEFFRSLLRSDPRQGQQSGARRMVLCVLSPMAQQTAKT